MSTDASSRLAACEARTAEMEAQMKKLEQVFENKATDGAAAAAAASKATAPKRSAADKEKSKKYEPKNPKGMRDWKPEEMIVRERVFNTIVSVFKKHGAGTIDTPVMELKATLTGKYGEDSKLIYDIADQGGELLALRYDLTVPFARFLAKNTSIQNIKRYHIARVYRRDTPAMDKGRYREFYQCDFDIAGSYDAMIPDAECIKVVTEILSDLQMGAFVIKINHRKLLDGIFDVCGVPSDKFRAICSAVDKLDKEPWSKVKEEMVVTKGLDEEAADRIGQYVQMRGGAELVKTLKQDSKLCANKDAAQALDELERMFEYCTMLRCMDNVSFDLSLARGLDYYTGVIYEAVLVGASVGSVAGGGRYDNLVGSFAENGKSTPCVGVSIGIERIFAIKLAESKGQKMRSNETEVLVAGVHNGLLAQRMAICAELWAAGIRAEFDYKVNPKLGRQFKLADNRGIPFVVLFGQDELDNNVVKIKPQAGGGEQVTVPRAEMVAFFKKQRPQQA